jgi:hypothetical protein
VYRSWVTAVAIPLVAGCGNSQSGADAADPYTCVMSGSAWTCPANAPIPQCPGNATSPINPGDPCSFDGGCFYCNRESAGIGCDCADDGDGGQVWRCVGAGFACMP